MNHPLVCADHVEDEHESEDEQDVFALEGRQGQSEQQQVTQTLDEAAADPAVSRGGWEGAAATQAAATQDNVPVASTSHSSPIDETADSLDSLMELTFDHLVWRCEAGQLQRTWAVMLSAFERTLLHTYRSKFTQFLVYYMCQQVCITVLTMHKTASVAAALAGAVVPALPVSVVHMGLVLPFCLSSHLES